MVDRPFKATNSGVRLVVRLTPRGQRNGIDGIVLDADARPALQLRVAAPPVDGAANTALIAYVAKSIGIRKSDIKIASGERSRMKMLDLAGDAQVIAEKLEEWIAAARVD